MSDFGSIAMTIVVDANGLGSAYVGFTAERYLLDMDYVRGAYKPPLSSTSNHVFAKGTLSQVHR